MSSDDYLIFIILAKKMNTIEKKKEVPHDLRGQCSPKYLAY